MTTRFLFAFALFVGACTAGSQAVAPEGSLPSNGEGEGAEDAGGTTVAPPPGTPSDASSDGAVEAATVGTVARETINFDAVPGHRYDFKTVWKHSPAAPRLTQRGVYVRRAIRDVAVTLPYNLRGIGTSPGDASIDAVGSAFQASRLDGLGSVSVAGYHRFVVGSVGAGANNVLESRGSDLALPAGVFVELHVLGLAVNGAQKNQPLVVHYTDGTSSTASLSFSDWVAEGRQPDERFALAAPSRCSKSGPEYGNFHLSAHTIPIDPRKTATSVSLPANPNIKIFAVTLSAPGH